MPMTSVFKSGNSQAVRLPKEFRVESRQLIISRRGKEIILREPPRDLSGAFDALARLPDDFLADRNDEAPQTREEL